MLEEEPPRRITRSELIRDILQNQEMLVDLSLRREQVKKGTVKLVAENARLKDCLDTLTMRRRPN